GGSAAIVSMWAYVLQISARPAFRLPRCFVARPPRGAFCAVSPAVTPTSPRGLLAFGRSRPDMCVASSQQGAVTGILDLLHPQEILAGYGSGSSARPGRLRSCTVAARVVQPTPGCAIAALA